jgi:hypothetical protein
MFLNSKQKIFPVFCFETAQHKSVSLASETSGLQSSNPFANSSVHTLFSNKIRFQYKKVKRIAILFVYIAGGFMTNKKFLLFLSLLLSCSIPERYPLPALPQPTSTGIEISPGAMTIRSGEHRTIKALLIQEDGSKIEIPFQSLLLTSDSEAVAFDEISILGVNEGISRVTASYLDKSAFLEVTVIIPPDYSKLRISEIMYNPAGDETDKEFIEIFNSGYRKCDLEGVSVIDGSKTSIPFVFGKISIEAQSFLVIAQSKEIFASTYLCDPGAYPFSFGLNDSGEAVFIRDPLGNILDSVYIGNGSSDFKAQSPWGTLSAPKGKSLRRINPMTDTDSPNDFEAAVPSPGVQ